MSGTEAIEAALEMRRRDTQRTIQKLVAELRTAGTDPSEIKTAVNRVKRKEQKEVARIIISHQQKSGPSDISTGDRRDRAGGSDAVIEKPKRVAPVSKPSCSWPQSASDEEVSTDVQEPKPAKRKVDLDKRNVELEKRASPEPTSQSQGAAQPDQKRSFSDQKSSFSDRHRNAQPAEEKPDFDVIVIPIFWRRHQKDRAAVETAVWSLHSELKAIHFPHYIDWNRERSPGQKFGYWENLGVQYRIEIGPDDAEAQKCRIIKIGTPGQSDTHERAECELSPKEILQTLVNLGMHYASRYVNTAQDKLLVQNQNAKKARTVEKRTSQTDDLEGNADY